MGETVKLQATDGHTLDGYVARPQGTPKAAVVVLQEAFGVNSYVRSVTDRFAAEGYLGIAPALFDRYERGFESGYEGADRDRVMAILPKLNAEWAGLDTFAAVQWARDEYKTKVAVVGFCLGGSMAWNAAARLPISVAVGYYGGMIPKLRDQQLKAPVMLHFGADDQHIPLPDVDSIRAAHPELPIYVYEGAGHGFSCDARASYNPEAAKLAWTRTLEFLDEHLGGPLDNTQAG